MAIIDGFSYQVPDADPTETDEWLESLDSLVQARGKARARFVLMKMLERARELQVGFPATVSTPYVNTIPSDHEPAFPGDEDMERRIRRFIRWNAVAMVTRANMRSEGLGGHLATYASSSTLYEVGFNHFFRGRDEGSRGDQVFFQGHAAPGIYARAFLEGRFDETHLDNFRRELSGGGLSSYPHPWLMPNFWQFPTVSMGLGPLTALYQARFNRYLRDRDIADTDGSKVWCFLGDGECDEPETLGSLSLAARESLDNLIFVVNCNLQRLDGPVRGNGKVIQELEAVFRGAGWNVIKVIWGSRWDDLLAMDTDGILVNKMNSTVDGEFQKYAVESGAYIRERFFGPDPRLQAMVADMSDDELRRLPRGGHDYRKVYAAYQSAIEHSGSPTVVLAKTIKGWTLGSEIEARNVTHQIKKMSHDQLLTLRDRLHLETHISDESLRDEVPPYFRPAPGTPEHEYLLERRRALGGFVPRRTARAAALAAPQDSVFAEFRLGSGEQSASTTMAFARMLRNLLRDPSIGKRIVPIVPDEARTFGLDALFRTFKIYAPHGQLYEPVDAGLLLSYAEGRDGQILEEGITEAGSMASFTAAGTSYATWDEHAIPFYIFYSMFGFQRIGDLAWAAADARARGFLLGATAGRTTLNGEGLQHQDGHSLLLASVIPTCRAYDPAFAYEVAEIVRDGVARMTGESPQDGYVYITLYNETMPQPAMPSGVQDGILRGLYRFIEAPSGPHRRATILFSGTACGAALEARALLAQDHDVAAECWSVTSYKALRDDALAVDRHARLHPGESAATPYITHALRTASGPFIAVTDFVTAVPDQVARWIPGRFVPLGTDGFGRSDARAALRRHFETDAAHVVVAVLHAIAADGAASPAEAADAIDRYAIDAAAPNPRTA
ncbi:MAG: pyruvate dehydrogenase (acetyl-transferring), homodimeric type [Actinomycetota bacterium]